MARILIVDDEPKFAEILIAFFHMDAPAWKVDAVETGEEALSYLGKHKVDLVISDIAGIGGPDGGLILTKKVSEKWPKLKVIIITGYPGDIRKAAFEAGAMAYLTKPVSLATLMKTVKRGLNDDQRPTRH